MPSRLLGNPRLDLGEHLSSADANVMNHGRPPMEEGREAITAALEAFRAAQTLGAGGSDTMHSARECSDGWVNNPTVANAAHRSLTRHTDQRSFVAAAPPVTAWTSSQPDFRARKAKRRSLGAPLVSYVFGGCGGWL